MMRSFAILAWAAISLSLVAHEAHADGNDHTQNPRSANRVEFTQQLILTSPGSKPRILDPKHDYVVKGDTIEVFITPEEDVFVYLGYCNGNDLALYPAKGRALRVEPRHRFKIPGLYKIDDDDRVLYVIASRAEVSLASPDLAIAISQSRRTMDRRAMEGDCDGGPGDGASSQTRSAIPIHVRSPDTAIKVVRYELLRRP